MTGGVVELDLHGMNTYQAQIAVDAALRRAGLGTYRLRLIHGYRGGTAIRDMLWLTYGATIPLMQTIPTNPQGGAPVPSLQQVPEAPTPAPTPSEGSKGK